MRPMKDSGIEWIGQIPQEWEVRKIKNVLKERKEKNDPIKSKFILSLGLNYGLVPYEEKEAGGNKAKEDYSSYNLTYPGDIVLNSMNIISGSVALSSYFGCISPVYYSYFAEDKSADVNYCCYVFQSKAFQLSLLGLGNGILIKESSSGKYNTVRLRIPSDKMGVQLLPLPPLPEQQAIAEKLDKVCGAIDKVIAKTKATVEEYKKLKQAIITEGVTGKKQCVMRNSQCGINEKWTEIKLKWVVNILDEFRKPVTSDERGQNAEILYDYYGASGVIDKIDGYTIDDHVMLIGEDGANLLLRNLPLVYEVNGKAWINNHAHILKPKENVMFRFLFFALEVSDIVHLITGSAQPKLSQDKLKLITIPLPPLPEQQAIVAYLDAKCGAIDELIAKKQQLITEMENYKKSVIYEYVTGKKEV